MKSYKHFKDIHDRWEDLPIRAKLKFFNLWFFITSFGNVANIIASLTAYNFLTQYSRFQWDLIILLTGFGCMMCWISIIQYLEHFPRYYYLILTLRLSTPRLAKFLVGVLPVFLGFAFFGVAYFAAYSDLFKDPGASSVTLFALLNGDVIHDVFDDIYDASPTISRIYLYVFIILFIYAVLNIFIAIVEDAFFAARRTFVEDLQKDLADRIKDPKDMDILGLLEGPPVPDPSLGQPQENKYSGLSFMQNQSMLNLLNEQQPTYENILEEPLVREPEPFELRSSRYVTNRESATVLKELFDSYMGEITNEINNLVVINDKYLTPPHSARFYPCAEENCIYCRMKDLFAANLEELKERTTEEFKLVREFQPDHVNMGIQNAEARWRESFSTVTTVDSFEGLDDIETTPQVNAKRSPTDDKSDLQKILQ